MFNQKATALALIGLASASFGGCSPKESENGSTPYDLLAEPIPQEAIRDHAPAFPKAAPNADSTEKKDLLMVAPDRLRVRDVESDSWNYSGDVIGFEEIWRAAVKTVRGAELKDISFKKTEFEDPHMTGWQCFTLKGADTVVELGCLSKGNEELRITSEGDTLVVQGGQVYELYTELFKRVEDWERSLIEDVHTLAGTLLERVREDDLSSWAREVNDNGEIVYTRNTVATYIDSRALNNDATYSFITTVTQKNASYFGQLVATHSASVELAPGEKLILRPGPIKQTTNSSVAAQAFRILEDRNPLLGGK